LGTYRRGKIYKKTDFCNFMVAKRALVVVSLLGALLYGGSSYVQERTSQKSSIIRATGEVHSSGSGKSLEQIVVMDPIVISVSRRQPRVLDVEHMDIHEYREQVRKEKRLIEHTIQYSERTGKCAFIARKKKRRLQLYCNGKLAEEFVMDLGWNPDDDKLKQGDGTTPEGRYYITRILDKGKSDFYRAFLINYPNAQDRKEFRAARRKGIVKKSDRIGGDIEIHGRGGRGYDWTAGCMAVRDEHMDVLFEYVRMKKIGRKTPVTIVKY
jgi:L,D-peptidoglycan transpeptidase YkuD (ErfK/YbiS/YcfS/YnhG family)